MAEQTPKQETKSEAFNLEDTITAVLADKSLSRQQKAEAIEQAYKTHAETVKAQLDAVAPPDPGEAIQKALLPVVEKMDLLLSKMGAAQQPQQPVQKSFVPGGAPQGDPQNNQLPISPQTGKPSALRAMINRSVGLQ